ATVSGPPAPSDSGPTDPLSEARLPTGESEIDRSFEHQNESFFIDQPDDPEFKTTIHLGANPLFEGNNKTLDDILQKIPLMYRLIDMVYETGSTGQGGLVEKFIIDQESLGCLLNKLMPGSFRSISSIDFKSLDSITIKPKGVYGSRSEIVGFLLDRGILNADIAQLLSQPGDSTVPWNLRSGLYCAMLPEQGAGEVRSENVFLVYWPEETTWYDDAEPTVQRNRTAFMRYLTQLSDQIIALVSKDQADAFVWESSSANLDASAEDDVDDDGDGDERMFTFKVQKSEDQEENVTSSPGFQVDVPQSKFAGKNIELIGGETSVGILVSWFEQARTDSNRRESNCTKMALKSLLSDKRKSICLGNLNNEKLRLLMNSGLRERYIGRFEAYELDHAEAEGERTEALVTSMRSIESQVKNELPQIKQGIRDVWRACFRDFESFIAPGRSSGDEKRFPNTEKYPYIENLSNQYARKPVNPLNDSTFQDAKARIIQIRDVLDADERTEEEELAIVQKLLEEPLGSFKDSDTSKKASWAD
ncbi:unnamed protein product, partial [Rhizoctonia solani]